MKTLTLTVPFELTAEEQLHVFAQYMEKVPVTDLSKISKPKFNQALREVLYEKGWSATRVTLPQSIELKKFDYRAALKGVLVFT